MVVDSSGNLYVASLYNSAVQEFALGSTTESVTYSTGVSFPDVLVFDSSGNLYVANELFSGSISMFAPGSTVVRATFSEDLDNPQAMAFDPQGNLYAANVDGGVALARFNSFLTTTGGGLVIQSSVESRPMSIGGTDNNAVNGINLTNAELAQIVTASQSTLTIGDTQQSGNITFNTAVPATIAGTALSVLQSSSSSAQIILNDGSGTGIGLNGNGGSINFDPGTGGIQASLFATGTPLASKGFIAGGKPLNLTLGFAPSIGTSLTVVSDTATPAVSNPINGTFSNVLQGGTVSLSYLGTLYYFQANYQGGDGNDLVLTDVEGPATQLVLTSQPSSLVIAGSPFGFTVTAENMQGSVVSSYSGTATIAIGNNPGGGTLGGTVVVLVNNGVAVFSGLSLNKAGNGYTLTVSGGTLASATTNAITVTPGAATQLLITTQPPATTTAGIGFGVTVTAEDAQGNIDTNFSGSETVALASSLGGGTLGGTLTVAAAGGISAFSGLNLNKVGSYTLAVTSGTLASATTNAISVTPGAATQLLITTQPPATTTAGSLFSFTVTAEDAQGNIDTNFSGSETVALASSLGGGTLGGTLTVAAAGGIAAFSGLNLNKVGSYTLAVTSGTLASATTNAISVTPGAATQLLITTQPPATTTAGSLISFTVTAEDAQGNIDTNFSGSETVALASSLGGGTLGGTLTVAAAGGIAAFSGLNLNKVGSYTLAVTGGTLASATTNAISVTPGAATQLLITSQPPATTTAGSLFSFTVTAEDAQGNIDTNFSGSETVALAGSPGGGTLGGTLTVAASGGIAAFSGLISTKSVAIPWQSPAAHLLRPQPTPSPLRRAQLRNC